MLQRISSAVREFFTPVATHAAFAQLKAQHPTGDAVLATMGQARQLLADLGQPLDVLVAHEARHDPLTGRCSCERRWSAYSDTAEVGLPSEVSRLFQPGHGVGMEVCTGTDRWTFERLETLHGAYEVLRHHGRLRGFQTVYILRSESRGPIRYR